MKKSIKNIVIFSLASFFVSLSIVQSSAKPLSTLAASAPTSDVYRRTPEQISIAISDSPTKLYVTFTTIDLNMKSGEIIINEVGKRETKSYPATLIKRNVTNSSYRDENGIKIKQKLFFEISVDNLKENTNYEYVCIAKDNTGVYKSKQGDFWSQLRENNTEDFEFIYISDPQINIADGKAASVTTEFAKTTFPEAKFLYVAGDLVNGSWPNFDEDQWEGFFNQPYNTYFNNNFENQMSNYTIAALQGNHDSETFEGHLRHPSTLLTASDNSSSAEHKLTYSFSWGMLRMIIINTEWRGSAEYKQQRGFVAEEVAKAKALGQYTAVGLHRPLYTGGDHVYSDDTVTRRKEFSRFFADLDIDMVLQGHDHVVARGQIDGTGYKVSENHKLAERNYYDAFHANAPLYFVGGTASTFKAYAVTNYTPGANDPVAPNYEFLDLNSAQPIGHVSNPNGPSSYEGDCYPSFTRVKVAKDLVRFDTYMYGYDPLHDEISMEPFLYDSYTMSKDVTSFASKYKNISTLVTNDTTSKVKVTPEALPGDTVLVSVVPGAGLSTDVVEVVSSSGPIALKKTKFGFTFLMPNEDVTIKVKTEKDPRLPLSHDSVRIASFGDEYAYKVENSAILHPDAFNSTASGWNSGLSPLGFGSADGLTLKTTLSSTVYPTTYFKKVFTLDSSYKLDDLYGIKGSHRIDDEMIMYLNGKEIYRFNSGRFGSALINSPLVLDGYGAGLELDALTREFSITNDKNNNLTYTQVAGEEKPVFSASSVTNLKEALKAGENVLTCIVMQASSTSNDLWFDLEMDLLFYSSAMHSVWNKAINELNTKKDSLNRNLYKDEEYNNIITLINEAIARVNSKTIYAPKEVEDLLNSIEQVISKTVSLPQVVINLIEAISDSVTESDISSILNARLEYDKLSAEQKTHVSNYSKLTGAEAVIKSLIKEIRISTLPLRTIFNVNDEFTTNGLKIEAVNYKGDVIDVPLDDCVIIGFDSVLPGTKTIIVSYGGKTTSFNVEVLLSGAPIDIKHNNYVPLIIGGAIGATLLVVASIVLIIYFKKKQPKR